MSAPAALPVAAAGPVERIARGERLYALVVRAELCPERTSFLTAPEATLQLGLVAYPAGHAIPRHAHRPIERRVTRAAEALVVRRGRCALDVYDDDREVVATVELGEGDVVLLLDGGHGFRMIEDTVLVEVKQGPYLGLEEKEVF